MLANRLRKRAKHLAKWARRTGVSCYRLYDCDIPEVPLVVDWYEGRLHVSAFARENDPQRDDAWLEALAVAAGAALEVAREDVFAKRRGGQPGKRRGEQGDGHAPEPREGRRRCIKGIEGTDGRRTQADRGDAGGHGAEVSLR